MSRDLNCGRVNHAQMKKLLDLLSKEGVLVNGTVTYASTDKLNFWKPIAVQLNAVEGGVYKNAFKWCKMWADWKNKTKRKANILLLKKQYNYVQPMAPLNSLELRLLRMINFPFHEKPDASDMGIVTKVEMPDPPPEEMADFLAEGYEAPLSSDHMSSDQDDDTSLGRIAKNKRKNRDDDDDNLTEDGVRKFEVDEAPNTEKRVKMKGKKYKRPKISLEGFKARTTMALERERVQQRNEELRLQALELKLRGEELSLKKAEMSKINHLTNIEEEKLQVFKDISSSLKELLDRTRNGNVRFTNLL